jgi:hypothetical protein
MKRVLRRVRQTFDAYAKTRGWKPGEFKLYLLANEEWGYIKAVLVGKDFPGRTKEEQWAHVREFIDNDLADEPVLKSALGFTVSTFGEFDEMPGLTDDFIEAEDI